MSTLDPHALSLEASRWPTAATRLEALGDVDLPLEELRECQTLGDLIEHYDFGEPAWNGALIVLASTLLQDAPTALSIDTWEALPELGDEYDWRFHHGDLSVQGSFPANVPIWVTGDLTVEGALTAGFLDSYPDLLVAGGVRAATARFGGLTMIAGDLEVERAIFVEMQGETVIRGSVRTPLLIGHSEFVEQLPQDQVGQVIELDDLTYPFESLADALGERPREDETSASRFLSRVLEG